MIISERFAVLRIAQAFIGLTYLLLGAIAGAEATGFAAAVTQAFLLEIYVRLGMAATVILGLLLILVIAVVATL